MNKGLIPIIIGNGTTPTPVGEHTVRYFDYDGTLLKTENLNDGDLLTPPSVPSNPYLIFNRWSNAIADYIFNGYVREFPTQVPTDFPMTISINGTDVEINVNDTIFTGTFIDNIIEVSGEAPNFGVIVIKGEVDGEVFQGTWTALSGAISGTADASLFDQKVYQDLDIGALYDTLDDKTYLFIRVSELTGYTPTIVLQKADTSLLTIDWGDGTSSTSNVDGGVNIAKDTPYTKGDYIITITATNYYLIGSTFNVFNDDELFETALTKTYISKYTGLNQNAFKDCINLETTSMPARLIRVQENMFYNCRSLRAIIYPPCEDSEIPNNSFYDCDSLRVVVISDNIVTIGESNFGTSYYLETLILPNTVTSCAGICNNVRNLTSVILSNSLTNIVGFNTNVSLPSIEIPATVTKIAFAFGSCYTLRNIYMLPDVPPNIDENTFRNLNPLCKIWVPADSYDAYVAAHYWITFASKIYVTE